MYTWGVVKLMDNLRVICKEIQTVNIFQTVENCSKWPQDTIKQ